MTAVSRRDAPRVGATLPDFLGAHRDQDVLVCGCGESLNLLERPERFITIGVNDVGRRFTPDYLVVVNPRSQFTADRFRYVETSGAKALFTQLADLGVPHPHLVRFRLGRYGGTDWSDPEVLHYTRNSPYVAVCLALQMGARRIGLLGVDFTEHHFFGKTGVHHLSRRLAQIDAEYARLAEAAGMRGIEILNLSPTSRLTALPRMTLEAFERSGRHHAPGRAVDPGQRSHRIISYATTPIAGVPAILARCIRARTPHASRCLWATRAYGNGVVFDGDLEWTGDPRAAEVELEAADAVIVHNGKVAPQHARILDGKPVVTLAHNYMWNVDRHFERRGLPALVVGQYQATLPEFAGWTVVPNPVPLWEPAYTPEEKPDVVTICYTPSGRHERYPAGHRLYWHAKGYDTTMRVLRRLAAALPIRLEVLSNGQVDHATSLAMKRRAHIVIDECVTGSYHRNSLEGLAAGCIVVNGVGLLPGVREALLRCAPGVDRVPFVFSSLDSLENVLQELIRRGPSALADEGRLNRAWMVQHWDFADQWERFWAPALHEAGAPRRGALPTSTPARPLRREAQEANMRPTAADAVSVIIPHGGAERLPQLLATLVTLRQRPGVGEVIVVEMGPEAVARTICERWADKHLFIEQAGPFERATALNAAQCVADYEYVLWHDNDLLIPRSFIPTSLREMRSRRLDYLIPYTSVRYLSEADSQAVMQGVRSPDDCRPVNTLCSGAGGVGLVRRDLLMRHGGYVEGFRGWGGEDNAWARKVALVGRSATTSRRDQHVYHLFHPASGGYQPGAAKGSNPHYGENVALLERVLAVRDARVFARQFPPARPSPGALSRSKDRGVQRPEDGLPVWCYWEGHCPGWIRACRRTIVAHAPGLRLLTPEAFDRLRDQDRDIDLSRLHAPHRADYVRAFLLQRYGGMWIDADCLLMQPLQPLLELLATHDFIGHRERVGLISNAFIAARPGSRIASAFYARVCQTLRSRKPLHWNALGADPLTTVVAADSQGWHELPCERVQPICWSHPEEFFAERTREEHERVFDPRAICYMLSNGAINNYVAAHPGASLLQERTFFSFLLSRALGTGGDLAWSAYEAIFSEHVQIYRRHGYESVSGPGSCLEQTQELRERLPLLLEDLGVRTLLDAPCGDLNWMRHVRLGVEQYIGVDVLEELIADHQQRHAVTGRRFICTDVIQGSLPAADAILCRDLLGHLPFVDIFRTLSNFKRTGATYLLATTFTGARPNHDVVAGGWRTLNLTLPPFAFPEPLRVINEKCTEGGGAFSDKSIGVWRLRDVPTEGSGGQREV